MGASFDIGPAHVKILIFFQASTWSSWVYCWDQGRIYSCGSIVLSTYRTQRNDSYVNVTFSSVCVCWVVSPVEEIVSKCKFKIYCNIQHIGQYDAVCQIHFMPPHSLLLLTSWHSNGAWRWRRVFQLMLLKYFQCKRLWKSPVKDLQTSHEKGLALHSSFHLLYCHRNVQDGNASLTN